MGSWGRSMEFSVVESGYDRHQVDAGLTDLADRLQRLAGQVTAAAEGNPTAELALVGKEIEALIEMLRRRGGPTYPPSYGMQRLLAAAQQEAADLRRQARAELEAAQREAQQIRDRAYAEALQARRDFEAALYARQLRAERTEELLRGSLVPAAPVGVIDRSPADA